jgi:hypothetical protein
MAKVFVTASVIAIAILAGPVGSLAQSGAENHQRARIG